MQTLKSTLTYFIVLLLITPLSSQHLTIWPYSDSDSLEWGVTNEVSFKISGYKNITALQLYFKIDTTQFEVGTIVLNEQISKDADVFFHDPSQTLIMLYYTREDSGLSIADSSALFTIELTPRDSISCFSASVTTIDQYDEIIVERSGKQFIPMEYIPGEICVAKKRPEPEEPENPGFKVINYFSPNGDGKNDFLEFRGLEKYPVRKLTVFSKWSNKVYESMNYENNWDGSYQNALVPEGNYYYVLKYGQDSTQTVTSMLTIHH